MSAIPPVNSEDIIPSTSDHEHLLPHPKYVGCYWCHESGSSSQRLKRCAKCGVVLYCSRECQVASWPTHKPECVAPIESERLNKLTKAYRKWIDVHQLSLNAMSGGLIRAGGGTEFNLTNGRSLLVTLLPNTDSWDDGDPAQWFSIADARMRNKDEDQYLDARGKKLAGGQPQAQESAMAALIPVGSDSGPDVLGVIPVTYFIVNERTTMHDLHAIHAQDPTVLEYIPPRVLGPEEEEFIVDAYDDLANLCIACINNGVVFHDPVDQRVNKLPEVGMYVRTRSGRWRWMRSADAWVILNVMMGMPDSGMDKAGWTAEKLWLVWGTRLCY